MKRRAPKFTLLPPERYKFRRKEDTEVIELVDTYDYDKTVLIFHQDTNLFGTGLIFIKQELNREFESYSEEVLDYIDHKCKA